MKLRNLILVMLSWGVLANTLFAEVAILNKEQNDQLMNAVKKVMPSSNIKKVMPTEIPNMVAVLLANEEIVYVNPIKKLIFIGEIYDSNGASVTDKHVEKIGATKLSDDNTPLDISPLFKVAVRMGEGAGKYGFIVFTDPDCPFCQQVDNFILNKNVTVDYIYTPIDSLHPHARAKAIKTIMVKNKISEDDAKKQITEGEKIATALGIKGTPQTIVYEISTKKPVAGIGGADLKIFDEFIKRGN